MGSFIDRPSRSSFLRKMFCSSSASSSPKKVIAVKNSRPNKTSGVTLGLGKATKHVFPKQNYLQTALSKHKFVPSETLPPQIPSDLQFRESHSKNEERARFILSLTTVEGRWEAFRATPQNAKDELLLTLYERNPKLAQDLGLRLFKELDSCSKRTPLGRLSAVAAIFSEKEGFPLLAQSPEFLRAVGEKVSEERHSLLEKKIFEKKISPKEGQRLLNSLYRENPEEGQRLLNSLYRENPEKAVTLAASALLKGRLISGTQMQKEGSPLAPKFAEELLEKLFLLKAEEERRSSLGHKSCDPAGNIESLFMGGTSVLGPLFKHLPFENQKRLLIRILEHTERLGANPQLTQPGKQQLLHALMHSGVISFIKDLPKEELIKLSEAVFVEVCTENGLIKNEKYLDPTQTLPTFLLATDIGTSVQSFCMFKRLMSYVDPNNKEIFTKFSKLFTEFYGVGEFFSRALVLDELIETGHRDLANELFKNLRSEAKQHVILNLVRFELVYASPYSKRLTERAPLFMELMTKEERKEALQRIEQEIKEVQRLKEEYGDLPRNPDGSLDLPRCRTQGRSNPGGDLLGEMVKFSPEFLKERGLADLLKPLKPLRKPPSYPPPPPPPLSSQGR